MIAIFAIMPITSMIAEAVKMGDPTIEYVSSKLRVPEEMQKISDVETAMDTVYCLDVELQATKRTAEYVNGTIEFNEDISQYGKNDYYTPNKNVNISRNTVIWEDLVVKEAKKGTLPFVITGLKRIPEKLTFKLSLNPIDGKIYSETVTFDFLTFQTTLRVIWASDPTNEYKSHKPSSFVQVKNTGQYIAIGIAIILYSTSVQAEGTTYAYRNDNGAITLVDIEEFYTTMINPGETKTFEVNIDCVGYSNGALNVGTWRLTKVSVLAGNADLVDYQTGHTFQICPRTSQSSGPHPIFIYYLWNQGGDGETWEENPRNYFEYGSWIVKAGLHRFRTENNGNPSIDFAMIIAYDDSTWNIPTGIVDSGTLDNLGREHFATQVNAQRTWWTPSNKISIYNCGFDILLMAAGRRDAAGESGVAMASRCIVKKSGPSTFSVNWPSNIDGLVQHEISHLFDCLDRVDGHPLTSCIMVYGAGWPPWKWYDHLHEFVFGVFNPFATKYWCSSTGPNGCTAKFDANWARFYSC